MRFRCLIPGRPASRLAVWLAIWAIAWQALQPYASLAAAARDPVHSHICPSTGLPSLALPDFDHDSANDTLHCGFCVGVQAPTVVLSLSAALAASVLVLVPRGLTRDAVAPPLAAALLPRPRGPPPSAIA